MSFSRMSKNVFGESSQFEDHCQSPNEEVKLYKKKSEELQLTLNKVYEENRRLQLELMSEKTAKEQVFRNAEMAKEKQRVDYAAKISSAEMEAENWKQIVEAVTKEKELLGQQYKIIQYQKTTAVHRLQALQEESVNVRKHKRSLDICLQNQKDGLNQLQKQYDVITIAKNQLTTQLEEQVEQINVFNVAFNSLKCQQQNDQAKITQLEQKVVELKTSVEQEKLQASVFSVREQHTNELITHLKNENKELLKSIVDLSESLGHTVEFNTLLKQYQETYERHKCERIQIESTVDVEAMELAILNE